MRRGVEQTARGLQVARRAVGRSRLGHAWKVGVFDDCVGGPARYEQADRVLDFLHAEFPALTFDVTAKVEHLLRHTAALTELAGLGCLFIVSAVESSQSSASGSSPWQRAKT